MWSSTSAADSFFFFKSEQRPIQQAFPALFTLPDIFWIFIKLIKSKKVPPPSSAGIGEPAAHETLMESAHRISQEAPIHFNPEGNYSAGF